MFGFAVLTFVHCMRFSVVRLVKAIGHIELFPANESFSVERECMFHLDGNLLICRQTITLEQ